MERSVLSVLCLGDLATTNGFEVEELGRGLMRLLYFNSRVMESWRDRLAPANRTSVYSTLAAI